MTHQARTRRTLADVKAVVVALALLAAACSGNPVEVVAPSALSVWAHAGTPAEQQALRDVLDAFEASPGGRDVALTLLPEGDYADRLQAAIAADELPDVLDLDGPLVASYAAQGVLAPLEEALPRTTVEAMLPTLRAQGTWQGRLWALGTFESGLGLWADARALRAAGVRVPRSVADAWSESELTSALAALARRDPDGRVLDLKRDYGVGEWLTYGFAPLLASAGGSLGDLSSPAALHVLTALGSWAPYVDTDADGRAFTSRRVPLSWVGHWVYPDYARALGRDLVLLPLPDLGRGSRTGNGSWAWGVSASSPQRDGAAALLAHLASDTSVLAVTAANGAVPGTASSLAASPVHAPGGPLHLYAEQLRSGAAVPRPQRPDYARVTAAFATAVDAVLEGARPSTAQRHAVDALG